ncbi:MAG: hypothetical protein IKJ05_08215 [Oscillospiraceae bacterium]|nr:hypothetical protein [Oscillospiraceae bacterium]
MNATTDNTTKKVSLTAQLASMVFGWMLITFLNLVPEFMGMPLVVAIQNYDPNAKIMDKAFDPGYFREYIARDGNLMAGGYLIHNDKGAWFWFKEEMIELQPEKNTTLTLEGNLEKPPVFCDNRYFISTGYTNYVGVGRTGKTSISFIEHDWTIDPLKTEDWRMDVYNLLARSETERLETTDMSTLVGYTMTNSLVGWDGETAYFYYFDEDAKAAYMGKTPQTKIALIPYGKDGKGDEITIPSEKPDEVMMCGTTVIYKENGVLKTYDINTGENRTVSGDGQTVAFVNYMQKDGHRVLLWVSDDGFHTRDLDKGNENFVQGDWVKDFWGLYVWDTGIYVLRKDAGYQSWNYTF